MNLRHELRAETARLIARRWFRRDCGAGLAWHSLLQRETRAGAPVVNARAPRQPHFAAKAKRGICLFQAGEPSHLELFDPKPELVKRKASSRQRGCSRTTAPRSI